MAEFVQMPKLGFNMEAGQLVAWHKEEGESIKKGDILMEISTDKTVMEIESTMDGTVLKLLVSEGDTVPVIVPVAIIGEPHEDIQPLIKEALAELGREDGSSKDPEIKETPPAEKPNIKEHVGIQSNTELRLTPKAKVFLQENELDVTGLGIKGTGFEGGVTASDLKEYLKSNACKITPLAKTIADDHNLDTRGIQGSGVDGKIVKSDVLAEIDKQAGLAADAIRQQQAYSGDGKAILKTIDYSGMRKIIGDRLSQSKFTAPHLYFTNSVDVSELMVFRQEINKVLDIKVSINDIVIGAVVKALQEHPELNSSLQGDKIIQYEDVNIGIAVGLESGLIVPVLKKAQTKKFGQMCKEGRILIEKARNGKLLPDDYQGGTFTVSNLGAFGIENFTAIINPPEVGILSVSAIKKTPVVIDEGGEDSLVIRPVMKITVSVDHRVIDGLIAARFMGKIKDLLEKPFSILM